MFFLLGQTAGWAKDVSVWVYHAFPPFIVSREDKTGISYDFVEALNEMSEEQYRFNIEVIPRQRLNYRLQDGVPGIVLWANPEWFEDQKKTNFLWSAPILRDRNVVVSPKVSALEYDGPHSLGGTTLIGVRGHRYVGIDPLIKQGILERIDLSSEEALLQFIAQGRGNVGIVPQSAVQYFMQKQALADRLYISDQPHSIYSRYILVQPQLEPLHDFIEGAIGSLKHFEDWKAAVERQGLGVEQLP